MKEVSREGPLPLFSFFLKDKHCLDFYVGGLQLARRLDDVTYCVLVEDTSDFHGSIWVCIDGNESVYQSHHQVAMHELKQADLVFWLVLSCTHFQ